MTTAGLEVLNLLSQGMNAEEIASLRKSAAGDNQQEVRGHS